LAVRPGGRPAEQGRDGAERRPTGRHAAGQLTERLGQNGPGCRIFVKMRRFPLGVASDPATGTYGHWLGVGVSGSYKIERHVRTEMVHCGVSAFGRGMRASLDGGFGRVVRGRIRSSWLVVGLPGAGRMWWFRSRAASTLRVFPFAWQTEGTDRVSRQRHVGRAAGCLWFGTIRHESALCAKWSLLSLGRPLDWREGGDRRPCGRDGIGGAADTHASQTGS